MISKLIAAITMLFAMKLDIVNESAIINLESMCCCRKVNFSLRELACGKERESLSQHNLLNKYVIIENLLLPFKALIEA